MSDSSQDKNLPATAQRLKKARDDGNIPRSKDLSNLSVLGGGAAVLMMLMPIGFEALRAGLASDLRFDYQSLQHSEMVVERLTHVVGHGLMVYLPLGFFVLAIAVGVTFLAGSWAISTKPITPDLTHLSPFKGIGRMFSKSQLFETAKLSVLTVIVGAVGWNFLSSHLAPFASLLMRPLEGALGQLGQWMIFGVASLMAVVVLVALVDFPMQKFLYSQRMKMSQQEVKQEHKQSEGDPQMKGRRRQRQRELAQRGSITAVPRADLVVVNPTHYAVALQYDDATMNAPRVIAKGSDLIAMKIREVAKANDIPVLQAPMLARALYAHAEIDGEIPSALYTAVAQVLAYVYQLKAAMRGKGVMPRVAPSPEVPKELDPHWKKPVNGMPA
ncbi:flagellar biosynthetic protein FlhB [Hydrogenophaga crassostreae]|uniref:Flagellar biosynthetic protein FlhB n=1 Tax=Hydrogenophaga crassostreae TaxID=1763535 RepID=A0A167HGW6_9BURK|nr:EscU/YscU/HrcU family type III secretion system export apparatus switch protein [Hydrogenophaga crassostreae]AOW12232.1 flagellar biosynthetic protein FlhB [Hydrogenophaga crassostreae]OAD41178.1 flagellar biosynthetic protein FlhB [Hydrogenophaga crassostreae]